MLTNLLRQEDLDPNIPLRHGKTALHIAVEQGHREIVTTLILWFADLSLQTADGKTALQIAVEELDRNMVELLLTKGARPDATYNNGTKLSKLPQLHLKEDEGDSVREAISSLLENPPLVDGPFKKGEHDKHPERPRRGG
jgi:ankyrin repeat protein